MSGHSKWSTIKRKKAVTDAARGNLFSKLAKVISVAIVQGGGANPDTNYRLKVAIEAAKAANMPKSNIDRLLKKAGEQKNFSEIVYEGFAPGGVGVLVDTVTDNKNRTAQEVKGIFDKLGGSLAGPGAVSFNFVPKGLIIIDKEESSEGQLLKLIDLGVEDFEEIDKSIEIYIDPKKLSITKEKLESEGIRVRSIELIQQPKTTVDINDSKTVSKIIKLLERLEEQDDVQKVYSNFDSPDSVFNEATGK